MKTPQDARGDTEALVERLTKEMAVTTDLLAGVDDTGAVLTKLAERAQRLTNADYAAISTFDETGKLNRFIFVGMDEETARKLGAPPKGRGLLGLLAHHEGPLRLESLQAHPASVGWPPAHPDMAAFLGVPIRALGRTIGSLYMTRRRGEPPFTAVDELDAAVLALQVATSLATVLAQEGRGRINLLEERVRIAHDLHDGTIQALYALGLRFDAVANEATVPSVRAALQDGVAEVNQQIADIRRYIEALESERPAHEPDLARDLPFVARQLLPSGVDLVANIAASALQDVTSRASEDLLFIAREALSNAVRHGSPTKVAIDFRESASEITLTIQDNGAGFDPATVRSGLGTITLRTRAERLGAELTILGIPGMGTTVRVAIPRE